MFPTLRQRLLLLLFALVGGIVLVYAADAGGLVPPEGSSGLSLWSSETSAAQAALIVILASLPAMVFGLLTASAANPLAGPFALATVLAVLAAQTGSMVGWRWRMEATNALPDAYARLIPETVIWFVPLLVLVVVIHAWRSAIRSRIPAALSGPHPLSDSLGRVGHWHTLMAGVVCAAVAGVIGHFVLASPDPAQVIVGLVIAFTVGGLVARLFFPEGGVVGMLFSPLLVAAVAYLHVLIRFDNQDQFVQAWQRSDLSGLALALPIHYASAAVAGAALGAGWAQSLEHSHEPAGDAQPPVNASRA